MIAILHWQGKCSFTYHSSNFAAGIKLLVTLFMVCQFVHQVFYVFDVEIEGTGLVFAEK